MTDRPDYTLRQLQAALPWSIEYSSGFVEARDFVTHLDFQHALIHVAKAAGKLAAMCDDADHGRTEEELFSPASVSKLLADLVICALRMANTQPHAKYRIELQDAVVRRLEEKNSVKLDCGAVTDALTTHERTVVENVRGDLSRGANCGALGYSRDNGAFQAVSSLVSMIDRLAPKRSATP
jgi:hypothetical protein